VSQVARLLGSGASGLAGNERCLRARARDHACVAEGNLKLHCDVVEQEAGCKVVGSIDDQRGLRASGLVVTEQSQRVRAGEVGREWAERDFTVDRGEANRGGFDLGQASAGVGFGEQALSLQVGELDHVAVEQREPSARSGHPRTRTRQHFGARAAKSAHAHDRHASGGEAGLALIADAREDDLTLVARRGHARYAPINVASNSGTP
jgi:hypothetical protein